MTRAMRKLEVGGADWPAALSDLDEVPEALHVSGPWPAPAPSVAIVGTRRPTLEALDWTRTAARRLAAAGVVIVSGGAYGVDAAAHEGALEADGVTIAVLGTPLERPYPADHAPLFERIRRRGVLVSELGPSEPVGKHSFLARNRLIAALARATVVVQAPIGSGALSTAAHARKLARPLFCVPWSPLEEAAQGGLALLVRGHARAILDAERLAREVGVKATRSKKPRPAPVDDPMDVLSALGPEPTHLDALALRLASPVHLLLPALLELELAGHVESVPGGYRRARG